MNPVHTLSKKTGRAKITDLKDEAFSRLRSIPWMAPDVLSRLLPVLIGCGMNGSLTALGLATLGISSLFLIDDDHLAPSDIGKSFFGEQDARNRTLKVRALAEMVKKINHDIQATCFPVSFYHFPKGLLLDTLQQNRRLVPAICVDNRLAMVICKTFFSVMGQTCFVASLTAAQLKSQIHVIQPGEGGCFACRYNERDYDLIDAQASCLSGHREESGVPALSTVASQCAAGLIHEILRHSMPGLDKPPQQSYLLSYSPLSGQQVIPLERSPYCPYHFPIYSEVLEVSGKTSLGDLFQTISRQQKLNKASIELHWLFQGSSLHIQARCPYCFAVVSVGGLLLNNQTCPVCHATPINLLPVQYRSVVRLTDLPGELLDITLEKTGVIINDVVLCYAPEKERTFLIRRRD
ncbi:ThiF family adenylyltransferase [candidate division KSB1 bacterium]|nr:ThiF family adenylyltransferase [candidate division KSB1 bacterium]